jgi:uncharacterized alkaline shock family protein YloU
MRKVERSEIKDLVAYEKAREAMRARVIEVKTHRRVAVGPNLTLLFENRDTVLFQIQEMVRTERIVDDAKIQEEVDVYNALVPDHGELSATLFIEIPELVRMTQEKVRETVNRFQGLDRDSLWLVVDGLRVPARFESGHSKEEKMAAVHYVRFALPEAARAAFRDAAGDARLVVEHPHYRAEATLAAETRRVLREDLSD